MADQLTGLRRMAVEVGHGQYRGGLIVMDVDDGMVARWIGEALAYEIRFLASGRITYGQAFLSWWRIYDDDPHGQRACFDKIAPMIRAAHRARTARRRVCALRRIVAG